MIGRTNTGGGGGGGLNFNVVGGTAAPSNPKENMIWVNTSVEITTWIFSATEPTNPVQGMVWILTGTSSAVVFNALKKNGLTVYPISVKQYTGGAWVDKIAKSWQDSKWVDWIVYLYNNGDTCASITGDWRTEAIDDNDPPAYHPKVTYYDDHVHIQKNWEANDGGVFCTKSKVDLTGKTKLVFKGSILAQSNWGKLCIWSSLGSDYQDNLVAYATCPITDGVTIDISNLSGEYIIGFWLHGAQAEGIKLYSLYLQ